MFVFPLKWRQKNQNKEGRRSVRCRGLLPHVDIPGLAKASRQTDRMFPGRCGLGLRRRPHTPRLYWRIAALSATLLGKLFRSVISVACPRERTACMAHTCALFDTACLYSTFNNTFFFFFFVMLPPRRLIHRNVQNVVSLHASVLPIRQPLSIAKRCVRVSRLVA